MNTYNRFSILLLLSGVFLHSFSAIGFEQDPVKVLVIPDTELGMEQLKSGIKQSTCVKIDDQGHITFKNKNIKLVGIGDAANDGGEDGRENVYDCLNRAGQENPGQVAALVGNRDGNKLRYALELAQKVLGFFRLTSWEPEFGREKHEIDGQSVVPDIGNPIDFMTLKLKWMLEKTMGCPKLFKNLKEKNGRGDVEVAGDYLAQWQRGGAGEKYLSNAQMVILNPAVKTVFAHGFLTNESLGYIPATQEGSNDALLMPVSRPGELQVWADAFNKWGKESVKAGFAGKRAKAIPFLELMEFKKIMNKDRQEVMSRDPNPTSIVQYHPYNDHSKDYRMIDRACIEALMNNGYNKVVFGHTPVGDVPLIIRDRETGFLMVLTDTTYAQPPRNAATEVEEDRVCIYSLFYEGRNIKEDNPGIEINIVADTRNPFIGTSEIIDGKSYWIVGQAQDGTGRYLKVNCSNKRDPVYLLEDFLRTEILPDDVEVVEYDLDEPNPLLRGLC